MVDLNHGVVNPDDRLTRIASRAISPDPAVVTEVAGQYCATLMLTGVHCTLKHFPGLGRVFEDTHKVTARLAARSDELEASDWLPFRELMGSDSVFTMLSHARLTTIDGDRPGVILRCGRERPVARRLEARWHPRHRRLQHGRGDAAATKAQAGGAVAALNAGVDLILVSYDPDQYFYVMDALLRGRARRAAEAGALEGAQTRLSAGTARSLTQRPRHIRGDFAVISMPSALATIVNKPLNPCSCRTPRLLIGAWPAGDSWSREVEVLRLLRAVLAVAVLLGVALGVA